MAGAISAGAYTAGVVDFLLEALDQWYATHNGNPPHDVRLRVISGASAGGIVGSILMASLGGDRLNPVRSRPLKGADPKNELYRTWVQEIDVANLLKSEDLHKKRVLSALDCTVLHKVAEHAIDVKPVAAPPFSQRRPYLADPLELIMTVANLRGVAYRLELKDSVEYMSLHADYMHFFLGNKAPQEPAIKLDPTNYSTDGWQLLARAALATGAFPFGLAPHRIKRPWDDYIHKRWPVTSLRDGEEFIEFHELKPVVEDLSEFYEFLSVDGGLLNNEPFNLAHSVLAQQTSGHTSGHIERDGLKSDRAIIMVAPFPSAAPKPYKHPADLLSYSWKVLSSVLEQVRFDPEVLILASDENIYSRFLVSPKRPEKWEGGSIACGTLEGFGGFIDEDFRDHDFMLGRRNCQWFLKRHFTLPCGDEPDSRAGRNDLFANWDPDLVRAHRHHDEGWQLPVIPCVGTAWEDVPLPDWPSYPARKLDRLVAQIDSRMTNVCKLLIDEHSKSAILRGLLKFALWAQKGKILRSIRARTITDLKAHNVPIAHDEVKSSRRRLRLWFLGIGIAAALALLAISVINP